MSLHLLQEQIEDAIAAMEVGEGVTTDLRIGGKMDRCPATP